MSLDSDPVLEDKKGDQNGISEQFRSVPKFLFRIKILILKFRNGAELFRNSGPFRNPGPKGNYEYPKFHSLTKAHISAAQKCNTKYRNFFLTFQSER